jgi:hypothetical protein
MKLHHALVALAALAAGCAGNLLEDEPLDTSAQSLTTITVTLQARISGHYLSAESGGGGDVNANRTAARGWETFKLLDRNAGALESGDLVHVQALDGSYLQAVNGGGGALNAASKNQLGWETFKLVRASGSGVIGDGDIVGLQTSNGSWVSATRGGGGAVDAHGRALSGWESFRIDVLDSTGGGDGDDPGAGDPGPGPSLVWQDEFNGSALDESKWSYEVQRPGWVNHELQNYTRRPENVRVENGNLVIEARRDSFNGYEYSSGRLKTNGRASWTYGRIEARMQLPAGKGTWPAFWMMPDDFRRGWPACGEIDILEHVGYDANVAHATLHAQAYNWMRAEQRTGWRQVPGATSGFHVYTLDWTPERIDISVDGSRYFTMQNPHQGDDWWPFDKNFYVILNLAVGGDWGGAQGVDPNVWPQRMLVDYVRVYEL